MWALHCMCILIVGRMGIVCMYNYFQWIIIYCFQLFSKFIYHCGWCGLCGNEMERKFNFGNAVIVLYRKPHAVYWLFAFSNIGIYRCLLYYSNALYINVLYSKSSKRFQLVAAFKWGEKIKREKWETKSINSSLCNFIGYYYHAYPPFLWWCFIIGMRNRIGNGWSYNKHGDNLFITITSSWSP